jgi:hypothetical protein
MQQASPTLLDESSVCEGSRCMSPDAARMRLATTRRKTVGRQSCCQHRGLCLPLGGRQNFCCECEFSFDQDPPVLQ